MVKKIAIIILALALLSVSSCYSNTPPKSTTKTPTTTAALIDRVTKLEAQDNGYTIQIVAIQNQLTALQNKVNSMQGTNVTNQINDINTEIATLKDEVNTLTVGFNADWNNK
jgi:peptidoglycan hydrolase CwlO-like protein